jgi:hypothetical protein
MSVVAAMLWIWQGNNQASEFIRWAHRLSDNAQSVSATVCYMDAADEYGIASSDIKTLISVLSSIKRRDVSYASSRRNGIYEYRLSIFCNNNYSFFYTPETPTGIYLQSGNKDFNDTDKLLFINNNDFTKYMIGIIVPLLDMIDIEIYQKTVEYDYSTAPNTISDKKVTTDILKFLSGCKKKTGFLFKDAYVSMNDAPPLEMYYSLAICTNYSRYSYFIYSDGAQWYVDLPYVALYISDEQSANAIIELLWERDWHG